MMWNFILIFKNNFGYKVVYCDWLIDWLHLIVAPLYLPTFHIMTYKHFITKQKGGEITG